MSQKNKKRESAVKHNRFISVAPECRGGFFKILRKRWEVEILQHTTSEMSRFSTGIVSSAFRCLFFVCVGFPNVKNTCLRSSNPIFPQRLRLPCFDLMVVSRNRGITGFASYRMWEACSQNHGPVCWGRAILPWVLTPKYSPWLRPLSPTTYMTSPGSQGCWMSLTSTFSECPPQAKLCHSVGH